MTLRLPLYVVLLAIVAVLVAIGLRRVYEESGQSGYFDFSPLRGSQ